jgi:hypothetical protein
MSDTNVHRVVGNLLVGTSHFFVDTTTNQVGINTSSPSAALDVATGDVKVGSGITLASSTGTITATGGFSGDGSGLSGVNSDSGSWVNGSSSNIHLAVSTDNVGIGVLDPSYKLDVNGDINISTGSTLKVGGTPAVFSNWSVHTNGSDIYRSSGNVGIGTTSPDNSLHIYKNANERTSGLFIEKAEGGTNAAALFFGVNNVTENPGVAKAAIFYERNLVNGRGDIKFCNDEVDDANAVTTEAADTRMIIKNNGNVGIGTMDPDSLLHVNGSALINSVYRDTFSFSGSYSSYTYIGRFSTQANGHVEVTSSGNSQFNTNTFDFQRQYSGTPYVSGINSDNYIHHRWFWKTHDVYLYDVWHYMENGGASSGVLTYRIQSHVYSRPSEPSSSGRAEFLYGIYQHNEPGRIDVGIGKRNPASALDVNGVIKQTGANWSLTNGGVQYASNDGTQAGTYAYLNRSLGSRNNVTLTHEYQNQKYTRSRVTVNQTGKYAIYINGFKQVNTSSTAYSLQLHKNGDYVHVRAYNGPSTPSGSYQNIGSTYTLMDLNANDYVEVKIGNGTMHGNDSIYFAGHLVA